MSKHSYTAESLVDARRSDAATRSSLKTRLKVSAFVGLAIIAAWLYYAVNQVLTLYDVTSDIQRTTDLRERVGDARNALAEAEDSLDRYTQGGEGYDLSRHHASRTTLRAALGATRRRILTESSRGSLEQAEASEEMYSKAADRAIARWAPGSPSAARQVRDDVVEPAAASLREALQELANRFGRGEAIAEGRLDGARDSATAALVILAALILAGVLWLLTDVDRHVLEPVVSASRALGDLASDREPPNLFEASGDEVGELGRQFNRAAAAYGERARALGRHVALLEPVRSPRRLDEAQRRRRLESHPPLVPIDPAANFLDGARRDLVPVPVQPGVNRVDRERRRVALCKVLLERPDLLLLDEPTNHLDAESVAWLERFLEEYRGTVIAGDEWGAPMRRMRARWLSVRAVCCSSSRRSPRRR